MQEGWYCPRCGSVHGPSVQTCTCQKPFGVVADIKAKSTPPAAVANPLGEIPRFFFLKAKQVWDVHEWLYTRGEIQSLSDIERTVMSAFFPKDKPGHQIASPETGLPAGMGEATARHIRNRVLLRVGLVSIK